MSYDDWKLRSDMDDDFLNEAETFRTGSGTPYPKRHRDLKLRLELVLRGEEEEPDDGN